MSQCGFPVGIRFDGATWWGTFHFWLGIAALVVMTGAEVLSHVYSVRKDTLVEEKQKADESAARKKQRELRKQVKAAEQKAADAAQRADVLEKHAAQRALSKEEHDAIVAAVSPFRGQRVLFASLIGDGDGAAFKRDIAAALRDAGWVFDGGALSSESAIIPAPVGVQVGVNPEANAGKIPPATEPLVDVLARIGVLTSRTALTSNEVPSGVIRIVVGSKPGPNHSR